MKNKYNLPTKDGYFGQFGGCFAPPALKPVLADLKRQYLTLRRQPDFKRELTACYRRYANRPSPLYFAQNLTDYCQGAKIYLKREDLNHTGSHKINNCLGQALLAKNMAKTKIIAETGAGQHGVAAATVAAIFGFECDIYMGQRDIVNQRMNVYRMQLLGSRVIPVTQGQQTLKDAVDAALSAFVSQPKSYYLLGSAVGPHPYPLMVRDFQKVIGQELRRQILRLENRLPDYLVACIGGGSNAIGLFYDFIKDRSVNLVGVEPAGLGPNTNRHGLSLSKGKPGIIHGFKCLVLQGPDGQVMESYSAASGLDYPGVGPEHCHLRSIGRLSSVFVTDKEAVSAFRLLSKTEGIIPALESAHAIAYTLKLAKKLPSDRVVVVNLSGRGDKDVQNVCQNF